MADGDNPGEGTDPSPSLNEADLPSSREELADQFAEPEEEEGPVSPSVSEATIDELHQALREHDRRQSQRKSDSLPKKADRQRAVSVGSGETAPQRARREDPDETQLVSTGSGIDRRVEGLVSGSITVIEGPPRSKTDLVMYNLIANSHPVFFYTGLKNETEVHRKLDKYKLIPKEDRHIEDISAWSATDLLNRFESLDLRMKDQATVVLDSVTLFEDEMDRSQHVALLRSFREALADTAVGIIRRVSRQGSTPDRRWITIDRADTIFEVTHDAEESHQHYLQINRLHPDQEFTGEGRTFALDRDDATMTLNYRETIHHGR